MADEAEQVTPSSEPVQETPSEPQPVEPAAAPAVPEPILEPTPPALTPEPAPSSVPEPVIEPVTPPPAAPPASPEPTAPPVPPASPAPAPTPRASSGAHMREVVRAKKQARSEKIVALAVEKRIITNDDVQKLLLVSHATATRYLSELVKSSRLKKLGHRRAARYEPM